MVIQTGIRQTFFWKINNVPLSVPGKQGRLLLSAIIFELREIEV